MPGRPRNEIVASDEIGFYHCYSRCVRQAFLCGDDSYTGKNYDHRKTWIEDRLKFLAGVMAVELSSHAVMDNHLHVVLRIRPDLVDEWTDEEIARRWMTVCPGKREKDSAVPEPPTEEQIEAMLADKEKVAKCRKRLCSLSWYMRLLKENISRRANAEDERSGAFWEGRFRSVQLLDVFGLLACLMYVDLNPVRAGKAESPESSPFTSAYSRIRAYKASLRTGKRKRHRDARLAASFLTVIDEDAPPPDGPQAEQGKRASDLGCLPMSLERYLQLLDWTGRQVRRDKRGAIPAELAPILERLEVEEALWVDTVQHFGNIFRNVAGRSSALAKQAAQTGRKWLVGVRHGREATACPSSK